MDTLHKAATNIQRITLAIGSTSRASFEENKKEAKREKQWVFKNDYKVKETTKS